jgi:hypothetical protein
MSERVDLTFSCNEDLNAMSCTDRGRFCNACQKEVIDYTAYRISDIHALTNSGEELCGIFRPDQLDPSLRPIQIPRQLKSAAFLSSIFIWLGVTNANAQSTVDPKFEQAGGTSNAPQLTPKEAEERIQNGTPVSMSIGKTTETESVAVDNAIEEKRLTKQRSKYHKKAMRKYKKKWYWNSRFPFVHKKAKFYGRF